MENYQKNKKQKGESIIMILIAITVLMLSFSVILPAITRVNVQADNNSSSSRYICRKLAKNVVSKLRSNGIHAKYFKTPLNDESIFLDDERWHRGELPCNLDGVQSEVGSSKKQRWPHLKVLSWNPSSKKYTANTPYLIQGVMNGLISIYNKNPSLACRDGSPGVPISRSNFLKDLAPEDPHSLNAEVFLKIKPIDTTTGKQLACAPNLFVRPRAIIEPPPAEAAGMIDLSKFKVNRALQLEVTVEPKGKKQSNSV